MPMFLCDYFSFRSRLPQWILLVFVASSVDRMLTATQRRRQSSFLAGAFEQHHHFATVRRRTSFLTTSARRRRRRRIDLRMAVTPVESASTSAASPSLSSWTAAAVEGPPRETKPNYESIFGPLGRTLDAVFLKVFRDRLMEYSGLPRETLDTVSDGYAGIIDITHAMNTFYSNRTEIQQRAQDVLVSLFPSWMPPWYKILFSKPFPAFSARMNAWATYVAGTWLMGECEVTNTTLATTSAFPGDDDTSSVGANQGLLVKRCRFLEESGCASICVNSCKIPTQKFFSENMGLQLTMEPNYETFECQFSFGTKPDPEAEILAKSIPCLSRCPTAGALRKFHNDGSASVGIESATNATTITAGTSSNSFCGLMGNE